MTNDVGDIATLTLTVSPSDGTTTATVSITSPTGTVSSPSTTPSGDRSVWTAQLPLAEPGEYIARWTVTGVGAGVEQQSVTARPTLPVVISGQRMYANTAELALFLEAAPPAQARRKLRHASQIIQRNTKCAVYATDDDGFPTDVKIRAAFRDAVCAQVGWWGETDNEFGTAGRWDNVKIGSVALGGPQSTAVDSGEQLAPEAESILSNENLLPGTISQYSPREGAWR